MGGSLGLALRARRGGAHVCGHDRDPGVARRALDRGAIDRIASGATEALEGAEVVFTAVPPGAALDLVPALLPRLGERAVLADLSSVMLPLLERVGASTERGRFVPSHPLCGSERDGIEAAREDLYRDRTILLGAAPDPGTPAGLVHDVWLELGASPRAIAPVEHDALLALTSHLPLLASTALVRAVRGSGRPASALGAAAGPGFRDASRLAGSSPALWSQILGLNARHLAPALRLLEEEVGALRRALEEDPARLSALLAEARRFRGEVVG